MKEIIEVRLRELRKTKNLSQEELAHNLGVSRQSIISLEHGEYLPSLPMVIDLVKFFEIPFEEIILCEGININVGEIDSMFEDTFISVPVINIRQLENTVIVEAELPGVNEDDIEIEMTDGALTIKGEKKSEDKVMEEDYYKREFTYGSFSRTVTLPAEIDIDKTEASMNNGTLRIELPKIEEAKPKTKKIQLTKNRT